MRADTKDRRSETVFVDMFSRNTARAMGMQKERKRERRKNAERTQEERRNATRAMGMQKERKAGRSKNAAAST